MSAFKDLWCIGDPVYIKRDGKPDKKWVGYIRRINWDEGLAEVGPETVVGSHLSVYSFSQLVPAQFTKAMNANLPAEILMLKSRRYTRDGRVLTQKHTDY